MNLCGARFNCGDLVEVGWLDIAAHVNVDNMQEAGAADAVNVGCVVNVAGGMLRLASGIYPGSTCGDVVVIPASVVRSVRVIEKRKAKR